MASTSSQSPWLDQYASDCFDWHSANVGDSVVYYRPVGLVEQAFDSDGRYFEGRADMNALLQLEAKHTLDNAALRERIRWAWTCLRNRHAFLQAKSLTLQPYMKDGIKSSSDKYFVLETSQDQERALAVADRQIVFLSDHFDNVNASDLWYHCQNSARVVDPDQALAKLFVLPPEILQNGNVQLRFLAVIAHQVVDGLTGYMWMKDFVHLLNKSVEELRNDVREALQPTAFKQRLPLAQEALYPSISGNRARKRWYWLLTRILRHVRKPLPAGFPNPIRRKGHIPAPQAPHPKYASVLDYSKVPPNNTVALHAKISRRYTKRLHRLCREAKVSIGSGLFALAAILMMEAYELQEPGIPLSDRLPFINGFPVNPRPFFQQHVEPESLMLAFNNGIMLPFLSRDLGLDGRIRLLAKQVHRQISAYQKRKRPKDTLDELQYMGNYGAGRILAFQYLSSMERIDDALPSHLRVGVNTHGAFAPRRNATPSCCNISSVGRIDGLIKQGMYDVNQEGKDFIADFRTLNMTVRARPGEFLVGSGGTDVDLWAGCSVDSTSMDPEWMRWWRNRFETILGEGDREPTASL